MSIQMPGETAGIIADTAQKGSTVKEKPRHKNDQSNAFEADGRVLKQRACPRSLTNLTKNRKLRVLRGI